MLLACSSSRPGTIPGCKPFVFPTHGSWFIQNCAVIIYNQDNHTSLYIMKDILYIMILVIIYNDN
jgi:hypothetical protein